MVGLDDATRPQQSYEPGAAYGRSQPEAPPQFGLLCLGSTAVLNVIPDPPSGCDARIIEREVERVVVLIGIGRHRAVFVEKLIDDSANWGSKSVRKLRNTQFSGLA